MFTGFLFHAYVEIHQLRRLVFDNYQKCPVSLKCSLKNRTFIPESNLLLLSVYFFNFYFWMLFCWFTCWHLILEWLHFTQSSFAYPKSCRSLPSPNEWRWLVVTTLEHLNTTITARDWSLAGGSLPTHLSLPSTTIPSWPLKDEFSEALETPYPGHKRALDEFSEVLDTPYPGHKRALYTLKSKISNHYQKQTCGEDKLPNHMSGCKRALYQNIVAPS